MNCNHENHNKKYTRRDFLSRTSLGMGALSLGSLLGPSPALGKDLFSQMLDSNGSKIPHIVPKAKRVIYLFQSGAPSQLDLFDYKPMLNKMNGREIPESILGSRERITGMTAGQSSFPLAGSIFNFKNHGQSGATVSDLMPYTSKIVDELCFIKSMYTEAINHDPAATFIQTGSQLPGRPSIGSWLSYGLGTDNKNLPEFVVLLTKDKTGQPLYSRLWGNGFLPSQHQGVQFRSGKDPVLYLDNPPGVSLENRKDQLSKLKELQILNHKEVGDPEILSRMKQYEMAFRMQTSVPEVMDVSNEPDYIFDLYGEDSKKPGTFAANCLLARKLIEKDVKFVQLYHQGWDQHGNLPNAIKVQCKDTDQPTAALIKDLKQRGLLDDTLVIWGGEFGRTSFSEGLLSPENYGRDHHPRCFTIFMTGAGIKKGITLGATDEFGYNISERPVHVHDFQATLMHLLGINHEKLTFKFQGRRYRLTDVHGEVVNEILS